ncbi:MAG TPA: DMT family transporter [Candidatus Sulfotelmatobacter sp.]|nr:DMT family transporter [Candidatus Sulfotelmatobacter sp.]
MSALPWLWIPLTVWGAFAQSVRNAAQRHLIKDLGTLGATLVRFLYGVPFALLWLAAVRGVGGLPMPAPNLGFVFWVSVGALGQIAATAMLLRAMAERNFAVGVVYSKTEIIQVAVFSIVFLGDPLSWTAALAILLASLGVILLSPQTGQTGAGAFLRAWTEPAARFGLGSGAGFAISAVGYRGASLALHGQSAFIAAAVTLVWAQVIQSVLLGGWLALRSPAVMRALAREWRLSLLAGCAGAAASAGWFTAMTLEPAAHVRTLGLLEVLFSYAISLRIFREPISRLELAGIALLACGIALIAGAA